MNDVQDGIKIAGRNINNLRYADNTTLMAESKEELKTLLMKVKEESAQIVQAAKGACCLCNAGGKPFNLALIRLLL